MREVRQKYCCANLRSIKVGQKMSSLFKYIIYVYFSSEATPKGLEISERQYRLGRSIRAGSGQLMFLSLENINVSNYKANRANWLLGGPPWKIYKSEQIYRARYIGQIYRANI